MKNDSLLIFFGLIIAGGMISLSNMYRSSGTEPNTDVGTANIAANQQPTAEPEPQRTVFNVAFDDTDPSLGESAKDGDVVIVEYSDYYCPFCKRFADDTFPTLISEYIEKGNAQFIYKDYPAKQLSPIASKGGNCVFDQLGSDGYFIYKDNYLSTGLTLGQEAPKAIASTVPSIDIELFDTCFASATDDEYTQDRLEAQKNGVRGTPGFIIGVKDGNTIVGELVSGAQPTPLFQNTINKYLNN